jgi:hypothetical protein
MTKVIDITGRQAESGKSYAYAAGTITGEVGVIILNEINPAYYEQVRKELLLTARKYAYKSRQGGIKP